jgi:hypothetical protein
LDGLKKPPAKSLFFGPSEEFILVPFALAYTRYCVKNPDSHNSLGKELSVSSTRNRSRAVRKPAKISRVEKPAFFNKPPDPAQKAGDFSAMLLGAANTLDVAPLPIGIVRDPAHERLLVRKGSDAKTSRTAKKPAKPKASPRKRATAKPKVTKPISTEPLALKNAKAATRKPKLRKVEAVLPPAPEVTQPKISYPLPASQNRPVPPLSTAVVVHRKTGFLHFVSLWLSKGSGTFRRLFKSKSKRPARPTTAPQNGVAELARLRAENEMLRRRVNDLLDRRVGKTTVD